MSAERESEVADFVSPWKDAIEQFFEAFIQFFFFAEAHAAIDWTLGYEFKDKEFQSIVRESATGRQYVDKFVKVYLKELGEAWILIHIEVQSQKDGKFELRMYLYNICIFSHFQRPVWSLALVADEDPNWRPNSVRV